MKLYEVTGQFLRLQEQLADGEDVGDALAALDNVLADKGQGIVHVLSNLSADAQALDLEIKRLQARKKAVDGHAARLREYMRTCMVVGNVQRIAGPTFTVTLTENPPRVEVEDEDKVPDEYLRTRVEVSKSAILANYKETGEIPAGVRIERGTRLTIR